jgi:hypothetical protein
MSLQSGTLRAVQSSTRRIRRRNRLGRGKVQSLVSILGLLSECVDYMSTCHTVTFAPLRWYACFEPMTGSEASKRYRVSFVCKSVRVRWVKSNRENADGCGGVWVVAVDARETRRWHGLENVHHRFG